MIRVHLVDGTSRDYHNVTHYRRTPSGCLKLLDFHSCTVGWLKADEWSYVQEIKTCLRSTPSIQQADAPPSRKQPDFIIHPERGVSQRVTEVDFIRFNDGVAFFYALHEGNGEEMILYSCQIGNIESIERIRS